MRSKKIKIPSSALHYFMGRYQILIHVLTYLHHSSVNLYRTGYDYGFCGEIAFITGASVGAIQTN